MNETLQVRMSILGPNNRAISFRYRKVYLDSLFEGCLQEMNQVNDGS